MQYKATKSDDKGKETLANSILNGSPKDRHQALQEIYKLTFAKVRDYINKNNGNQEDAKDIFQEGITIVYYNILTSKFKEESSLSTYLFSICKNLWLQNIRKKSFVDLVSLDQTKILIDNFIQHEVNASVLSSLLEYINTDCQKLLFGFYYDRKSMKELAKIFKLGNEQVARTKKLRCLNKLSRVIKEKGLQLNSFFR
jgi:RNA polymerase sigma factor (sigma-70 family)